MLNHVIDTPTLCYIMLATC